MEKETSPERKSILKRFFLVNKPDGSLRVVTPGENPRLENLIASKAKVINDSIDELKQRKIMAHTKRKPYKRKKKSVIERARQDQQREINRRQVHVDILERRKVGLVKVKYDSVTLIEGFPEKLGVSPDELEFAIEVSPEQLEHPDEFWWNQVSENSGLMKMHEKEPERFRLVQDGVTLRIRSKYDPIAQREYFDVAERLIADEVATVIVVRLIQKVRT